MLLLLFQEDTEKPVTSLVMGDLPTNTILYVIEQHQLLHRPRLSSQIFNALCPEESWKMKKFFTKDNRAQKELRQSMHDSILSNWFSPTKKNFLKTHLFQNKDMNQLVTLP